MKMPRSPSHPTHTTFLNFSLRNLPPWFWFLLTEPGVTAPMTFLNVQFCQSEVLLQTSSWPMPRKKTPLCVPRSFFPCLVLMVKLIWQLQWGVFCQLYWLLSEVLGISYFKTLNVTKSLNLTKDCEHLPGVVQATLCLLSSPLLTFLPTGGSEMLFCFWLDKQHLGNGGEYWVALCDDPKNPQERGSVVLMTVYT